MSAYLLIERATSDLRDIWDYIAADSTRAADDVIDEIHAGCRLISRMPGAGHRREDVRDPRHHFWRVNRFIIAYFPDTRPVQIIRIVRGQQDFRRVIGTK